MTGTADKHAFQIDVADNVATALDELKAGDTIGLRGDTGATSETELRAAEDIPKGHKIALRDISEGASIVKYSVVIGRATRDIASGQWVHLHCMCSVYDERSSHLDVLTGAPKDTSYE